MAEKRSIMFSLFIISIVLGVGVVYSIMNSDIASDNLSDSVSLPELAEDLPLPETSDVIEISGIALAEVETKEAASESKEVRDPQVAGEITKNAVLDSQQRQDEKSVNEEVSPTAETGLSIWFLVVAVLAMLLGLLGLYLAPKVSVLR